MKSLLALISILYALCMVGASVQSTYSQKLNTESILGNISNQLQSNKTLEDDYKFFTSKYDSDQINDVIYRLYEDFRNSNKNEISHYQDIAILTDFICSNKLYENSIEAYDIITEFPIE
jgi:hypothetical protein